MMFHFFRDMHARYVESHQKCHLHNLQSQLDNMMEWVDSVLPNTKDVEHLKTCLGETSSAIEKLIINQRK